MANETEDFTVTDQQASEFREFLSIRRVLISDSNQSIRSSLSKVLTEAGAKSNNIRLASTMEEAIDQIRGYSPEIVVTDYNLDTRCGLELIQHHRDALPEPEQRLFILVTGNSAESVVAEAAEGDVDSYILKPFTTNSIRFYLTRAGLMKMRPSPYRSALSRGKQLLEEKKHDEALGAFNDAMKMTTTPTLACYYLGQSYDQLGKHDHSEQSYKNGLIYNAIHYKCSVALFDFYANQGRAAEAYDVMKRISKHFPISPQRLSKAIELAVRTQNFDDIEHYYSVFAGLDERRNDLRKCVCAALVVASLFRLRQSNMPLALELLQKAATTAAGNPSALREIVMTLVNFKLADPAMSMLKRFAPDVRHEADYLCSDFAVLDLTGSVEEVIVRGRKLLRDGVQDPIIHRIMIRREIEAGHAEQAEQLAIEAENIWPTQAEVFRKA